MEVGVEGGLEADEGLGFLIGFVVEGCGGVFASVVFETFACEAELVDFGLRGGLGEGFGEEEVSAV